MKLFRTAILIFSVVLWGCIGEDLDNCPPDGNLVLRFSYVIDGNEVFLQRAEKASIFIFDERGYFVREETIGTNSPNAGRSLSLSLSPGTYSLFGWANMLEKTGVSPLDGSTHFESAFIRNTTLQEEGSYIDSDPLYYTAGSSADRSDDYRFTVPRTGTTEKTLDFTSAHIKLQAFIEDFTDPDGAGGNLPPVVEVEGLETKMDFSMRPFGDTGSYVQQSAYRTIEGTDLAVVYFNLPPFKDDNSVIINIKKASDGTVATSIPLKDYMADNDLTVENIEEAVIPIHISYDDSQNVKVTITLPKWGESPVKPEL